MTCRPPPVWRDGELRRYLIASLVSVAGTALSLPAVLVIRRRATRA